MLNDLIGGIRMLKLVSSRLPTQQEVLKRYFKLKKEGLKDVDARSNLSKEISQICTQLKINCQREHHINRKILKLVCDLKNANKSKPNSPLAQRFIKTREHEFDVRADENRRKLKALTNRRNQRENQFKHRTLREENRKNEETTIFDYEDLFVQLFRKDQLDFDDANIELIGQLCEREDEDFKKEIKVRTSIISDKLLSALDRSSISSRNSFRVLATFLSEINGDLLNTTLSYSTIWRERKRNQLNAELSARDKLDNTDLKHLSLHFDGIRMLDLELRQYAENLVIVVTKGDEFEHLVAINQLESGTAESITESIINEIEKYKNLKEKITLICHDTPAVNTGIRNGVIVRLFNYFNESKLVINAPCRYHVLELISAATYKSLFGIPSGPSIPLFVNFQKVFKELNLNDFDKVEYEIPNEEEYLEFIDYQLSLNHKRADYKEFLQLARMFIRQDTIFTIKSPGADSQSRWMSKFIYCLKIYLFRKQLTSIKFKCSFSKLREFCLFGVKIYLKHWFEARKPIYSVLNDLKLFQSLLKYEHQEIAKVAIKSFSNHLQYLTTPLSTFCLFDERVSAEDKNKMIKNLEIDNNVPKINEKTKIYQLINKNNLDFLKSLNLDLDFLEQPASN